MRTIVLLFLLVAVPARAGLVTSSWNPVGGQPGGAFGSTVAPAGDVNGDGYSDVLVGAPLYDDGQVDEGLAVLYLGGPNGLSNAHAWLWEPNQANAHAGAALAGAGDVNQDGYSDVLIAAPDYDRPGHVDAGAVFVFYGSASGLHATPDDTLANDVTGSHFGASLSFAGFTDNDTWVDIVIGAPDYSNGQANEGAVYVYKGGNNPFGTAPFIFEGSETGARAGAAVSGGCDLNADGFADILVGEPGASPGGHARAGRAIVLPGSSGGVTSAPIATLNGTEDSLAVGAGVAFAGDVDADGYADVLVGTPGQNGVGVRRGAFLCLRGTAAGFDPTPLFVILGSYDQDRAGAAVATAGDLDGDGYADFAFPDPNGYPAHQGVANMFYGGRAGTAFGSQLGGAQPNWRFGAAVATAGDVDGDGFSDLIVGAPAGGVGLEGTAYLFFGRPRMPSLAPGMPFYTADGATGLGEALAILPTLGRGSYPTLMVGEPGYGGAGSVSRLDGRLFGLYYNAVRYAAPSASDLYFGSTVVNAGDVNRDGIPDFAVGSPSYSADGIGERGRVVLFLGNTNAGLDWTPSPWVAQGTQVHELFGVTIAAGDVNGDGYTDIAIGGWGYGSPQANAGKASLYLGGPSGPGSSPAWTKTGTAQNEYFGDRVAMLDFDADGYQDLAVSVASNTAPRVDIFYGGPGGLSSNPGFSLTVSPLVPTWGSEIANVGDFNGDGVDDLVVGAPDYGIWFYPGNRARAKPLDNMVRHWKPASVGTGAGYSIAGGGDLDGDGLSDFVVGAPYESHPEEQEGVLYVFRGRPGDAGIAPDTTYESDVAFRNLGYKIAPLADLSGDGFADIVSTAYSNAEGGQLYFWLGGGEGTYFGLEMYEQGFGLLISPAVSTPPTQFGWSQHMRTAAGRARVTAELEARVQGTPFTGLPTHQGFYLNLTSAPDPVIGSETGGGFVSDGFFQHVSYHVRGRASYNSPYFPHTRWVRPDGHANVYDFRTGGTVTGTAPTGAVAIARIGSIAPNPARGAARIAFELPARAAARLDVYDVRGRHVRTLASEPLTTGVRTWDGTDEHGSRVPPGLYFVELRVGNAVDRGRIVLMD